MSANPVLPLAPIPPATARTSLFTPRDSAMRHLAFRISKRLRFDQEAAREHHLTAYMTEISETDARLMRTFENALELRRITIEVCSGADLFRYSASVDNASAITWDASDECGYEEPRESEFDESHFLPSEAVLEPMSFKRLPRRQAGITPYVAPINEDVSVEPDMDWFWTGCGNALGFAAVVVLVLLAVGLAFTKVGGR